MRWIVSDQPAMVRPRGPVDRPAGACSLEGVEAIDLDGGTFVISSDTGGWVWLDAEERALLGPDGLDRAPASVLDALWARGVATVGGRGAFDATDLQVAVDATRDTYMLVLLLNEGCNLVCSYCYLGHAAPSRSVAMDHQVALDAIDAAFRQPYDDIIVDFGEITVAERMFRTLVLDVERHAAQTGKRCAMSVQTNGTTLTDELADFLAAHGISAGISVDGPADIHDEARVFRSGLGSHAAAVEAVRRCKERGVSVHIPVTVARHNVDRVQDVLAQISELRPGSHLLKPLLPQGEAGAAWDELGITVERFAAFLTTAISDAAARDIDLLDTSATKFLRRLVGDRRGWGDSCTSRSCGSGRTLHVVDRHGSTHACPRFVGDPPATRVAGLSIGRRSPVIRLEDQLSPTIREAPTSCAGCPWLRSCGGGCTLAVQDPLGLTPLPDPQCDAHDATLRVVVREVLPRLLDGAYEGSRLAAGIRTERLVGVR